MEFGDKLKFLREKNNLSREDLAIALNITYSALSKYETNNRFPDKDTLLKIAKYFDVSIDYLLGRSDIQNSKTENIKKTPETLDKDLPENKNESNEPKLATTEMVIDKLIKAGLLKDDKIDARIANMLLNSLKIDIELKLKEEEEKKKGSS